MSSGPALGGDKPNEPRKVADAMKGWHHLQRALGYTLPRSTALAIKTARSVQRGRG